MKYQTRIPTLHLPTSANQSSCSLHGSVQIYSNQVFHWDRWYEIPYMCTWDFALMWHEITVTITFDNQNRISSFLNPSGCFYIIIYFLIIRNSLTTFLYTQRHKNYPFKLHRDRGDVFRCVVLVTNSPKSTCSLQSHEKQSTTEN